MRGRRERSNNRQLNITKAADAAVARLRETRKAGRPYNEADQILAFWLGPIFRRAGIEEPTMRDNKSSNLPSTSPAIPEILTRLLDMPQLLSHEDV